MVAKYILTDYISQSQSVQKHAFLLPVTKNQPHSY